MRRRVDRHRFRWVAAVGIVGTVVLAVGAFSLSFTSLMHLALRAGIAPAQAWEWPLIVDGMIIVATVGVVARAGRRGAGFAWVLLIAGAATSIGGNATQAAHLPIDDLTWVAVGVATIPPLVLLASTHMTVILTQRDQKPPTPKREASDPMASAKSVKPGVELAGHVEPGAVSTKVGQSPISKDQMVPARLHPETSAIEPDNPNGAKQQERDEAAGSEPGLPVGDAVGGGSRTWRAERAQGLRAAGLSVSEIAEAMDVSTGSVRRWLKSSLPVTEPRGDFE